MNLVAPSPPSIGHLINGRPKVSEQVPSEERCLVRIFSRNEALPSCRSGAAACRSFCCRSVLFQEPGDGAE